MSPNLSLVVGLDRTGDDHIGQASRNVCSISPGNIAEHVAYHITTKKKKKEKPLSDEVVGYSIRLGTFSMYKSLYFGLGQKTKVLYLFKLAWPSVKSDVACHKVCFLGCGLVSLKNNGRLAS